MVVVPPTGWGIPIASSARQKLLESTARERCVKISKGLDALLRKEQSAARWELITRFDTEKEEAEAAVQEARWAADAVFEGKKNEAVARLRENNARLAARVEEYEAIAAQARALLAEWKQPAEKLDPPLYVHGIYPTLALAPCSPGCSSGCSRT